MSARRHGSATGPLVPGEAAAAPFAAGTQVLLRQYELGEDQAPQVRDLGIGQLENGPELGERLEIRIRGERGLASSTIQALHLLGEDRLLVITVQRAYLLSRIDAVDPAETSHVEELVRRLLTQYATGDRDPHRGDAYTEYIRLDELSAHGAAGIFKGGRARIALLRKEGGEEEVRELGIGMLLSEVEAGAPVRFSTGAGQVIATSAVECVRWLDARVVEATTANSRYRFELVKDDEMVVP